MWPFFLNPSRPQCSKWTNVDSFDRLRAAPLRSGGSSVSAGRPASCPRLLHQQTGHEIGDTRDRSSAEGVMGRDKRHREVADFRRTPGASVHRTGPVSGAPPFPIARGGVTRQEVPPSVGYSRAALLHYGPGAPHPPRLPLGRLESRRREGWMGSGNWNYMWEGRGLEWGRLRGLDFQPTSRRPEGIRPCP